MNGILLINKEKGMTSHDVIYKLKKILNVKKIGHAGTLDPNATGLLVVLINEATKLSNYLMEDVKEYIGEIIIGEATLTEDGDSEVTDKKIVDEICEVDKVLASFIGKQKQIPPMYSAIKVEGKKLYDLARCGKTIDREERDIEIFDIKRLSEIVYQDGKASFSFYAKVSKGTYIRTLCVDIGRKLMYPAHMGALQRIASGSLKITDSYRLDDIRVGNYHLIDMLDSLKKYPIIDITDELFKKINNGVVIDQKEINQFADIIVFKKDNRLVAIYQKDEGVYRAERVWN